MQRRQSPQSASKAGVAVELDGRDQGPQDDPRAVLPRDQHRVLAVEPDAAPGGSLAVDVLVRIDEHAVVAAKPAAEHVEPLAQRRVPIGPGVARKSSLPRLERCLRLPVAERGGDDGARVCEQRLGVTGALRLRHRELHSREEPATAALDDVSLGVRVGLCAGDPESVKAQLLSQTDDLGGVHATIVPR